MINYSQILTLNYAGTQWALSGEEYSGLEWYDSTPKPTQADLDGQWAAVKAQIEANAYKEQRATAYPSIADQLDTIYHEGLDAWKATILAVKEEFPK
jgi:hypothetical protein